MTDTPQIETRSTWRVNRRSFLTSLMALPVLRRWKPKPPEVVCGVLHIVDQKQSETRIMWLVHPYVLRDLEALSARMRTDDLFEGYPPVEAE